LWEKIIQEKHEIECGRGKNERIGWSYLDLEAEIWTESSK
jgi:hypothetical protein